MLFVIDLLWHLGFCSDKLKVLRVCITQIVVFGVRVSCILAFWVLVFGLLVLVLMGVGLWGVWFWCGVLVFRISFTHVEGLVLLGFGFWGSGVLMLSVYTTQILWFWVLGFGCFKVAGFGLFGYLGFWVLVFAGCRYGVLGTWLFGFWYLGVVVRGC